MNNVNIKKLTGFNTNILHKVEHNETIESIARKYNNSPNLLRQVNKISNVEVGDILLIPQKNKATYVVKPLDTFESLSNKFGVSIESIKSNNNTNKLFIGQTLII